ncbi:MAG: CBS domain-containing protein [Desulfovibrionaceae bacterium]
MDLDASVLDADALVVQRRFNAIPVLVEAGRLQGEVSRKDILSHICRIARIAE